MASMLNKWCRACKSYHLPTGPCPPLHLCAECKVIHGNGVCPKDRPQGKMYQPTEDETRAANLAEELNIQLWVTQNNEKETQ